MDSKEQRLVLLLDNDPDFRANVSNDLQSAGWHTLSPSINVEAILTALQRNPTDVILDINLGKWKAPLWLAYLRDHCAIDWNQMRLWVISGMEEVVLQQLRQEFPTIQSQWLRKPLQPTALDNLLKSCQQSTFKLPDALRLVPLPLRVIDSHGSIVFTSQHWESGPMNRPDTNLFLPFSENKIPAPVEFWSSTSLQVGADPEGYYRMDSFPIENGQYLAQIAHRLSPKGYLTELPKLIRQAFLTMKEAGFTRGRFYRIHQIPGCAGMMELVENEGVLKKLVTLPHSHSPEGTLAQRFYKYMEQHKHQEECTPIINILTQIDLDMNDEAVSYWEEIVGKRDLDAWIEVPVFRHGPLDDCRIAGFFSFDRKGSTAMQDGSSGSTNITEQMVDMIKDALGHILLDVTKAVDLEEREKELEQHRRLLKLDAELYEQQTDRALLENLLLKTAIDVTKASGGTLVKHEGAMNTLLISSTFGEKQGAFINNNQYELTDIYFPIVQCWTSGKEIYLPRFDLSPERTNLLQHFNESSLARKTEAIKIYNFFESKVKSYVAIPIWWNSRKVGAIGLYSDSPYTFDIDRINILQALLQRVRWFLHAARLSEERRHWEHAFVHEMRSDLLPMLNALDALSNLYCSTNQDFKKTCDQHLLRAKRSGDRLWRLSQNFMDLQTEKIHDGTLKFDNPGSIIEDYINLYNENLIILERNISIKPDLDDPVWKVALSGSKEVFQRVVRNILDNAVKFGEEETNIDIRASKDDTMWKLIIDNQGEMSPEEDALKFIAYKKPDAPKRDGAHVGLAASRVWVNACKGSLSLDNITTPDGGKLVRAEITWPLTFMT
ncbi:MAG: HAMP domain-containing histidine kinase [Magnetococcus sp. YQC-5]